MTLLLTAPDHARDRPKVSASARGPILIGCAIIGVMFGGLGTWAAVAPLNGAAIGSGVIKVEANRQAVQHLDGGIVRQLLVKEGDRVTEGQTLIRLDDTAAKAALDVLTNQMDALLAVQARLVAERDRQARIGFGPELLARASEPAVASLMASQEALFEARRRALEGQVSVQRQKVAQLQEQIRGSTARATGHQRQFALVQDELSGTRELYQKGYAPKTKVLALERAAAALDAERLEFTTNATRAREQIGEAELAIQQIEKDRFAEIADQLRDAESKLLDLQPRLRAARDTFERSDLKAPQGGHVVGLTAFTVGGVIGKGERVLDIVPVASPLVVEAQIRPEDVHEVEKGATVEVHLSAFKQRAIPVIHGKLVNLSADRITDQRTGLAYYLVQVIIDAQELAQLKDITLTPGMPVEVMIPTRARTALDYLLAPLAAGFNRAFREQ